MTIRTIAPLVAGRGPRQASSRFSIIDELNCYFDSAAEPNNVQLEAWLPGHLSPERLRTATAAVLADVPAARARRAAGRWWRAGYCWEVPPAADIDPVSVTAWQADEELEDARARFLAAAPHLDRSPPFRLLLAQGPEWDSLILNAHHAAFDGRSCQLLLHLIADRYNGMRPRDVPSRDHATGATPRSRGRAAAARLGAGGSLPRRLPLPVRRAARIASQHKDARAARDAPGSAISLLEWPGVPATPHASGGSRVTVNDLLITALIQAIARWNTPRRQPPAPVRISMPIDTRQPGQAAQLGNLSRLCTVSVDPHHVADPAVAVAGQTRAAKATPGPLASPVLMMLARTRLPARLKRGLVRLGLHAVGSIGCDSSLLSNLGNVTDPPAFGMLTPMRMWFSPSTHMPLGLSVGAITVGGRLQLCFRYCTALLDAAAGQEFIAEYAAALSSLSAQSSLAAPAALSTPSALSGPAGGEACR